MPRILLVASSHSYRIGDFLDAAYRCGADVTVATDGGASLAHLSDGRTVEVNLSDVPASIARLTSLALEQPIDAIVPVDERVTYFAALLAEALNLPHNSVTSVRIAGRKDLLRASLTAAKLPQPCYRLLSLDSDPGIEARKITFPCVIKPISMSGSRGVIRANSENDFTAAFKRVVHILENDALKCQSVTTDPLLVESFVPGAEFAVEGLVAQGKLAILAIFDKLDSLNGPFFPETFYVTPSRCSASDAHRIQVACSRAVCAVGITSGPVHIELRLNDEAAIIIECAARTIGGLCGRMLRFEGNMALEDLVIAEALGKSALPIMREQYAVGVLMIQVPYQGVLTNVLGVSEARSITGVESIDITIPLGERVVPLPEGDRYLGFVIARDATPEGVEEVLRRADQMLNLRISQV